MSLPSDRAGARSTPWRPTRARCRSRSGRRSASCSASTTGTTRSSSSASLDLGTGSGAHAADVEEVRAVGDERVRPGEERVELERRRGREERVGRAVEHPHDERPRGHVVALVAERDADRRRGAERAHGPRTVRRASTRAPCGTDAVRGSSGPSASSRSTSSWRAASSSFARSSRSRRAARRYPRRGRRPRRPAAPSRPGGPPRRPRGTAASTAERLVGAALLDELGRRARRRRPRDPARAPRAANSDTTSPFSSRRSASVRLGQQPLDELAHLGLGERADERVDDLAADEGVHRGDRLGAEGVRDLRVGVDVDLHELDLALGLGDDALEDRAERLARPAPLRPQVDDDRHGLGPLDRDLGERGVGRVDHAPTLPAAPVDASRRAVASTAWARTSRASTSPRVSAWLEANVPGADRAVRLRADRRRPLQPHVPRDRRARAASWALRRPPVHHVLPTAHDMVREHTVIAAVGPAGIPVPDRRRPVHRRVGERAALLRDGVRRGPDPARRAMAAEPSSRRGARRSRRDQPRDDARAAPRARPRGRRPRLARAPRRLRRAPAAALARPVRPDARGRASTRARSSARSATRSRSASPTSSASRSSTATTASTTPCSTTHGGVRAILDWEICTLGDPLADIGLLCDYWADPGDAQVALVGAAPTTAPGFETRDQVAQGLRGRRAASTARSLPYYRAFGYWKLACILQGVYARYAAGATAGDAGSVDSFPAHVVALAESARDLLGDAAVTGPDERVVVIDEPRLTDPALVVAFEGWIDAGFGAATAVATLLEVTDSTLVATFDGEYFLDQRARRPMARIVDGVTTELRWPEIQLRHGTDGDGPRRAPARRPRARLPLGRVRRARRRPRRAVRRAARRRARRVPRARAAHAPRAARRDGARRRPSTSSRRSASSRASSRCPPASSRRSSSPSPTPASTRSRCGRGSRTTSPRSPTRRPPSRSSTGSPRSRGSRSSADGAAQGRRGRPLAGQRARRAPTPSTPRWSPSSSDDRRGRGQRARHERHPDRRRPRAGHRAVPARRGGLR